MKVITTYKTFKIYQISYNKFAVKLGDETHTFNSVLKAIFFIDKL